MRVIIIGMMHGAAAGSADPEKLLDSLSVREKAALCTGGSFWETVAVPRLGIRAVSFSDGPHGLRRQVDNGDMVGLGESAPATCFPTAAGLAASWDVELLGKVGRALGEECLDQGVDVLLGPGINIKRSPLCGRNFEYFSEDPFLAGELAVAFINGVQSTGVGTSVKHFAANNQERRRMTVDARVDERALREIYLAAFERAVKGAKPATVMAAYNRLNGFFCTEHRELLTSILRDEWGYSGVVISDWGATRDRAAALAAGLDLEMPGPNASSVQDVVRAVASGRSPVATLDAAAGRVLSLAFRATAGADAGEGRDAPRDDADAGGLEAHHRLAREAAIESAVLLKNDNAVLPLRSPGSIAIIGDFAKNPRYQGNGSSLVHPRRLSSAWDALVDAVGPKVSLSFAAGYDRDSVEPDPALIAEAAELVDRCDVAVVFAGLPESAEFEGADRRDLSMPASHNELIEAVAAQGNPTVVVLANGAPVAMPWLSAVDAVLETYLGGEASGEAVGDLLLGRATPSGKLAETFPISAADAGASANFPGDGIEVVYAESIYVGYRYFEKARTPVLFPFGHGLSYTTFAYADLNVTDADPGEGLFDVTFTVANSGIVAGAEVAQLYVRARESAVFRAEKELKGFAKVRLEPAERTAVTITLDRRAFSFWDTGNHDWCLEAGRYEIEVGASSADIRLRAAVEIETGDPVSRNARASVDPAADNFAALRRTSCHTAANALRRRPRPVVTPDTLLEDIRIGLPGRLVYRAVLSAARPRRGDDLSERNSRRMLGVILNEMSLRQLCTMSRGKVPFFVVEGLVELLNRRPVRCAFRLGRGIFRSGSDSPR